MSKVDLPESSGKALLRALAEVDALDPEGEDALDDFVRPSQGAFELRPDWPAEVAASPRLGDVVDTLYALEISLLTSAFRKSDDVAALLADDFVEFGSSGREWTKSEIVAALRAAPGVEVTPSLFTVRLLAPTVALVTYEACRHSSPPVTTLRSSIWRFEQQQWRMVFHQGTVMPG